MKGGIKKNGLFVLQLAALKNVPKREQTTECGKVIKRNQLCRLETHNTFFFVGCYLFIFYKNTGRGDRSAAAGNVSGF